MPYNFLVKFKKRKKLTSAPEFLELILALAKYSYKSFQNQAKRIYRDKRIFLAMMLFEALILLKREYKY